MVSTEEYEFMCDKCQETKALREEIKELTKSLTAANETSETRIKNAVAGRDYRIKELEAALREFQNFTHHISQLYVGLLNSTTYGKIYLSLQGRALKETEEVSPP
jgi:hypothetical protein